MKTKPRCEKIVVRDKCPWCFSQNFSAICDVPFTKTPFSSIFQSSLWNIIKNEKFAVLRCEKCETLFLQNVFVTEFIDEIYSYWSFSPTSLEFKLFYLQELLMIMSHLNKEPGEISVLDYGMGWGKFCEIANALDFNAVGYEISPSKIEYARNKAVKTIDSLNSLKPESLDFINVEQVLEHLIEPRKTVQSLMPYLKKNGVIKLSVPHRPFNIAGKIRNISDWKGRDLYKDFMEIWPLSHINCFNRNALKMVEEINLKHINIPLNTLILPVTIKNIRKYFYQLAGRPVYKIYSMRSNYLFFKKIK
ncbi:MAG: class I SAM-dependent methyltransferase [Elusimicrobia bacterium]|nr:class I SAM-dependent methyltransferase [Elusimicrobiota bacterium]